MSEPKKKKEKAVLLTIDNLRIVEIDDMNVIVERFEESTKPKTEEVISRWRFKGYYGTILSALRAISRNEWLVDKSAISDLESYLKQVERSNAAISEVIET